MAVKMLEASTLAHQSFTSLETRAQDPFGSAAEARNLSDITSLFNESMLLNFF
jgi:hypothetical protein